jgi:hypothetical protein
VRRPEISIGEVHAAEPHAPLPSIQNDNCRCVSVFEQLTQMGPHGGQRDPHLLARLAQIQPPEEQARESGLTFRQVEKLLQLDARRCPVEVGVGHENNREGTVRAAQAQGCTGGLAHGCYGEQQGPRRRAPRRTEHTVAGEANARRSVRRVADERPKLSVDPFGRCEDRSSASAKPILTG